MRTALLKILAVAAVSVAAVATPGAATAGQSFPDGGTGYLSFACYSSAMETARSALSRITTHSACTHFDTGSIRANWRCARGSRESDLAVEWTELLALRTSRVAIPVQGAVRACCQRAMALFGLGMGAVSQNGGTWYWGGVCST